MAAASVALVVGCSLGGDPVQGRFESRDKYPSCGEVEIAQGDTHGVSPEQGDCMREALKTGKGAELSISYPTVEGDEIRDHFRLTPKGKLELYSDATDDAYSDQKWEFTECIERKWLPEIACD